MIIFLKFLPIFFGSICIHNKIFKDKTKILSPKFNLIIISLCISLLAFGLYNTIKEFMYIIPILILWFITSLFTAQPQKSFVIIMISFTISYSMHALISFILTFIMYSTYSNPTTFPYDVLAIFSMILHVIMTFFICKTKRLYRGQPLLSTHSSINIATLICILLALLSIFVANNYHRSPQRVLFLILSTLTLAFLIYWWQAQITKTYRRNLELRELESMRTEMIELKRKMEELTEDNERLARITHRDNTLISALKNATVKYLSTDFENPAIALETRNQLIENINTLSAGRSSLSETRKEQSARTFETSSSLLNELLHEMDEKAIEMKITFAVHMGTSLDNFIPDAVSESDLVHTVDDLLKNAFKAVANCEKRIVQLQFYKLGKHFVAEVADSGIPFEVKSLVNMGIEKLTTYEDGSGIGLMDIWSTKETYGATYHLDECVIADPFTKKISLTFDKKNRYSIRTLRKNEILQMSRRADLQVYDYNE